MERRETGENEERRENMVNGGGLESFANRSSVVRYDESEARRGGGEEKQETKRSRGEE
jgi:hypothetical protein